MRISDWSSDVCSSDLADLFRFHEPRRDRCCLCGRARTMAHHYRVCRRHKSDNAGKLTLEHQRFRQLLLDQLDYFIRRAETLRSEEHTSELQSLMRISYAVFCLKKKNTHKQLNTTSR